MKRTLAHGSALASLGALLAVSALRCADVNRGLGEACIRNEDCLSGLCAGQTCVAQPTLFDASTTIDSGTDASTDAPPDTRVADAIAPSDAPSADARVDAKGSGSPDARVDGASAADSGATKDAAKPDAAKDAHATSG